MRAIHRSTAEEYDVISLDLKINILKTNMLVILVTEVHQIGNDLPMLKIPRAHQGEQVSDSRFLGGINSGRNRIIVVRFWIVLDHEF